MANEATKILHGEKKTFDAEKTAKETFEGKGFGKNLPETLVGESLLRNGMSIIELIHGSKIMFSKSEIKRAIKEKGIKVNDILIESEKNFIYLKDFKENGCVKISHGKKKHFIVRLKKP